MENEHLAAVIRQSIQSYAHETAMRYQKAGQWQDISYQTLGKTVDTLARALLVHGVQPGDRIGIFAENRPEWALVDFAILSIRAVSVPIYATNTKHQAAYIIEETAMNLIFTGG